jgi:hypothetical protein
MGSNFSINQEGIQQEKQFLVSEGLLSSDSVH